MNRIIFESSPYYILLCVAISVGLAWLLYKTKNPWGTTLNKVLFAMRAVLLFLLLLLLLGPIVRQIKNNIEKPVVVLLQDNSASVKQVIDSAGRARIAVQVTDLQKRLEERGYEVEQRSVPATLGVSDFTKAFRSITSDFEGKKVASTVFVSDGIYNAGVSPLYSSYSFPILTVGVGDTTQRTDVVIRNVAFNKVAYQGNRFPLRVEVSAVGFQNKTVEVQILHRGKRIDQKMVVVENEQFTPVEFQLTAEEKGIQRYEVVVTPQPQEWNKINNRSTIFLEVVDGKKKILALASSPHPDVKALRAVIEQNVNYEFTLFVPSVSKSDFGRLLEEADLVIAFQAPDVKGVSKSFFQQIVNTKKPLLLVLGTQADWRELVKQEFVRTEAPHRQYDEVVPALNPTFTTFLLSQEVATVFNSYPPASVPFAKFQWSASSVPILFQKVGSLVTDRPLLTLDAEGDRKLAVMLGEGLWRWRLHEYSRNESTEAFDELFGKLIQYLSTADDRRRFRCYPIQQQFSDTEPVVLETQVYNEIFEPIYGQTIDIELTSEAGQRTNYQYTTSVSNTRYALGSLPEGVYRYKATTQLKQREEVRGEFLVTQQQLELQNLKADFNLLRKLSAQTGGAFYNASQMEALQRDMTQTEPVATIHSEEKLDALINLKWVFVLLLLLVSTEWLLRKYYGGY
jgi:hypothetical protein